MAAPLGNKFAIGNNGGRPPKYDTPEELMQECAEYFEYIQGEYKEEQHTKTDEITGESVTVTEKIWIRYPEPATITGLTLYLGFSERGALSDYAKKEEFAHVIKRAKMLVENAYENRLHGDKNTGAIFALKNMGWKDTIENTTTLNASISMSKEEEKQIAKDLEDEI